MISEDIEDIESDTYDIPYYESVVWMWESTDWYSMLTGEPLTGYEPSKRMIELTTDKFIVWTKHLQSQNRNRNPKPLA